jgi:hypothetical protein
MEMEMKRCKQCQIEKLLKCFRPHALTCKTCNGKNEKTKKERNKKYYEKHTERIKEHNVLNYYKSKYDDNTLTLHEINLLKIKV